MFKSYTKRLPNIDSEFKERVLVAYSLLSDEMKQRPAHHVATHLAEHFLAAEPKKKSRAKVPTRGLKPLALLILGILATVGDVANGTLHQIASAPETARDAYMDVINGAQLALQGGDDNDDILKELLEEEGVSDDSDNESDVSEEEASDGEEETEATDDSANKILVDFKETLNKDKGWSSYFDPDDNSRLQTNADYAKKVINHASKVMKQMSASDARKLDEYAKPIIKVISKDLIKQMLSHDRDFVSSSLDLALQESGDAKSVQEERIEKAIEIYKPIVDKHTEVGFTDSIVNDVVQEISDGDAIVDWYNDNVDEKTPEQLFRTYAHKYSVDIQEKVKDMDPKDLNQFSEEFYFKVVIMDVATADKKLKKQYEMNKYTVNREPENKLDNLILQRYKKACQKKQGIAMPKETRAAIKLYGDRDDENSKTTEIIEDVKRLWELQDQNMTEIVQEAEKARIDELNNRFSYSFTRIKDLANAKAQGIKEVYDEAIASAKEYLNKILYACVALGTIYVITKSKEPERVMDGGETKQNEETKQSERRQPRPRARTPIRSVEYNPNDVVFNEKIFSLQGKKHRSSYNPHHYWIQDGNYYRRLKQVRGGWKITTQKLMVANTRNITPKGHIDDRGVIHLKEEDTK